MSRCATITRTELVRVGEPVDGIVDDSAVAVLGFHDGAAGQVATWFEGVTGYRIVCFVHDGAALPEVDAAEENRKRVSQRTEFPTRESFKGRPLITSLNWLDELAKRGIRKVLPLSKGSPIPR